VSSIKPTSIGRWNQLVGKHARDSDRAVAIWAGSFVETHLKNYLACRLRTGKETQALFDTYGPLSTFAGCIGVAYAIRLLNKPQRDDLDLIRRIRNHFAHHPYEATFTDEEVVKHLSKVTSFDPFEFQGAPLTKSSARVRYMDACGMICAQLSLDPSASDAA
jgi:hypothetical protein